jgi:hypothetical protein
LKLVRQEALAKMSGRQPAAAPKLKTAGAKS